MFDYTILGGKYNRATLVLNTVQILCKHNKLNIGDRWKSALVLGWCIEIVSQTHSQIQRGIKTDWKPITKATSRKKQTKNRKVVYAIR